MCARVCTHTYPSDLENAKAAALVNTTSESSSSFMLIVSVSFIYARETMQARCKQLSANNRSVFAGEPKQITKNQKKMDLTLAN